MERSLIILKPDCLAKKLVGTVIARFDAAGFSIVGCKMIQLTAPVLRDHYAHIADQPYYPPLAEFMASSPVIVLALAGDNAIARIRELLGPTDSRKAPKGTIRGDFGTNVRVNIAHASDSVETATIELARFFRTDELFA